MASLYDIDKRLLTYREEFDQDTGEWLNEAELDDLMMEREEKIEQLLLWTKNIRAEASMVKAEADKLAERYKALEKKADRIEHHIAGELDGEKFSTPRVTVSWRKSETVVIPDDYKVPDKFCNCTVERKPDKASIKKYLKEAAAKGESVGWATINVKNNMNVR